MAKDVESMNRFELMNEVERLRLVQTDEARARSEVRLLEQQVDRYLRWIERLQAQLIACREHLAPGAASKRAVPDRRKQPQGRRKAARRDVKS